MIDPSCAEVQAAIRAGGRMSDSALGHAATCPACGELLADGAVVGRFLAAAPADPAGDDLAAQVLDRIHRDRNPLPRLPSALRALVVWLVIALPATALLGLKPRPDLGTLRPEQLVLVAVAWVVAGALAARVALRPVHRPGSGAPAAWVALALALPVALGLTGTWGDDLPWLGPAVHCFSRGAATAAAVVLVLWLTDRRSATTPLWWAGASGLAAVAGGLMLHASCGITGVAHLAIAHGAIGAALAAVAGGAALLRARWR